MGKVDNENKLLVVKGLLNSSNHMITRLGNLKWLFSYLDVWWLELVNNKL